LEDSEPVVVKPTRRPKNDPRQDPLSAGWTNTTALPWIKEFADRNYFCRLGAPKVATES